MLDADALWELEPFVRNAPTVLTPHTGELARLLGATSAEIDLHRLESVRRAASRFASVVLLKGADTLVAAPREGVLVASYGTPALATAGSGDVLTGVVACFLAKGMDPKLGAGNSRRRARRRSRARRAAARRDRLRPAAGVATRACRARPAARAARLMRSEITIDLGALRRNIRSLLRTLDGAELWAVVKADAYGHGAVDCGGAALDAGATALCVATVPEALVLRQELPSARIIVLGPTSNREVAQARNAALELGVASGDIPEGVRVHVKLETGMGRWGVSELPMLTREVVGVMTHLATADSDPDFARAQVERFREATDPVSHLTRHVANSAAALRLPESRFDAARCGIAIYGISPFGEEAAADGLEPVLSWQTEVAQARLLRRGESTGYGRRYVAERDTWIGILPVGYADGFRRDLTGTRGAGRGRAAPGRRHGLDGRNGSRARPRAAAGDAGDARRSRRDPRESRARRLDDRLRARLRDRVRPDARTASHP